MDYDLDGERCSFKSGVRDRIRFASRKPPEESLAIEDGGDRRDVRRGLRCVADSDDRAREKQASLVLFDAAGTQVYPERRPSPPRNPGRTCRDLTDAERRELEEPCPYQFPVRLASGPMRAVARAVQEALGVRHAKSAMELVQPNPEDRITKMRAFFDAFWNVHCGSGL